MVGGDHITTYLADVKHKHALLCERYYPLICRSWVIVYFRKHCCLWKWWLKGTQATPSCCHVILLLCNTDWIPLNAPIFDNLYNSTYTTLTSARLVDLLGRNWSAKEVRRLVIDKLSSDVASVTQGLTLSCFTSVPQLWLALCLIFWQ